MQVSVTDSDEESSLKASLPRMVFPEALFPEPVLPSSTTLRGDTVEETVKTLEWCEMSSNCRKRQDLYLHDLLHISNQHKRVLGYKVTTFTLLNVLKNIWRCCHEKHYSWCSLISFGMG